MGRLLKERSSKSNRPRPLLVALLVGTIVLVCYPALAELRLPFESAAHARVRRNVWFYGMRGVIRGRVSDARGRPLAGVSLMARFRNPATGAVGEGTATSDARGRYEIGDLDATRFHVMAWNPPGNYAGSSPTVDLRRGREADGIDLTLP